jgi:hypothetical protein
MDLSAEAIEKELFYDSITFGLITTMACDTSTYRHDVFHIGNPAHCHRYNFQLMNKLMTFWGCNTCIAISLFNHQILTHLNQSW